MRLYRVHFSEKDSQKLAGREVPSDRPENDVDFSQLVVNKPWGYEYLVCTNPYSQVWALHIVKDALTSMHAHPNKRTALICLKGEVLFSTLNTSIRLKALDSVMIDAGVFHSTRALSKNGADVFEVESPPLKYDLIRLKDSYGREGKFYEGADKMRPNDARCLRFPKLGAAKLIQKKFLTHTLSLKKIALQYKPEDLRYLRKQNLMIVLEGNVHSQKGQLLHSVVDVIDQENYLNNLNSHVITNLTLLSIQSHG